MSRLQTALHAFPPGSIVTPAMLADTKALHARLDELHHMTPQQAAETRARRTAHLAKVALAPNAAS